MSNDDETMPKPEPMTIGAIKAAAVAALKAIDLKLHAKRAERDRLNEEIRTLVAERAEAQRYVTASEPRSKKP